MFTERDDGCSCYGSISGHSSLYWYLENAYRVCLCEFVPGREIFIVKVPGKLESFCLAPLSTSMAPHLWADFVLCTSKELELIWKKSKHFESQNSRCCRRFGKRVWSFLCQCLVLSGFVLRTAVEVQSRLKECLLRPLCLSLPYILRGVLCWVCPAMATSSVTNSTHHAHVSDTVQEHEPSLL